MLFKKALVLIFLAQVSYANIVFLIDYSGSQKIIENYPCIGTAPKTAIFGKEWNRWNSTYNVVRFLAEQAYLQSREIPMVFFATKVTHFLPKGIGEALNSFKEFQPKGKTNMDLAIKLALQNYKKPDTLHIIVTDGTPNSGRNNTLADEQRVRELLRQNPDDRFLFIWIGDLQEAWEYLQNLEELPNVKIIEDKDVYSLGPAKVLEFARS